MPQRIVLHSTETDSNGVQSMKNIVSYWKTSTPGYGAHLIIDGSGTVLRAVADRNVAWHTGGNNTGSLGIEQVGHAAWPRRKWWTRPRQLMRVASWLAWWSVRYGIPLEPSISHGVSTHAMNSKVFPASAGHWDPGEGYPFLFVLKLARTYKRFHKWNV